MKKTILAKLKSDSGASLMAALLFFIMCATVGSIILAAATASSGRLAGLKRNEQAHYAVNSAADVLANVMEDKKVVMRYSKSEGNVPTDKQLPLFTFMDPASPETAFDTAGSFLLPNLISQVCTPSTMNYDNAEFPRTTAVKSKSQTFTVDVAGEKNEGKLDVSVEMTLYANLELVAEITPADSAASGSVKMRFKPVVDKKEQIFYHNVEQTTENDGELPRNVTYTKTYTISWTDPVIE